MALTVLVITYNAPRAAEICLRSLLACGDGLASGAGGAGGAGGELKFVLLDDCSDPRRDPSRLFGPFREQSRWPVVAQRFRSRVHYAAALSHGMALAGDDAGGGAGADVLFVSHDMILTHACVDELFALREAQPAFGVLRPRSGHMDFAAKMVLKPAMEVRAGEGGQEDAETFARQVRRQHGGQVVGWPALIGDAMLVRREVIAKIGGMDPRFYGYWADIDYGVRVQRGGWRHGIAAGAWLHHSGSASGLEDAPPPEEAKRRHEEMTSDSTAAYALFRRKWGEELLPAEMGQLDAPHLRALRSVPLGEGLDYHRPVPVAADLIEEM
jgi:hypothetical protein